MGEAHGASFLVIRKTQLEPTMRRCSTSPRMVKLEWQTATGVGGDVQTPKPPHLMHGDATCDGHSGQQFGNFLKT